MDEATDKKVVAPGMEMVITAGELYDIADETGQGLSLKGVESPWAMEFFRAFDAYLAIRKSLGRDHEQTADSFERVMEAWEQMPLRIVQDMPSYKVGGIIVPGGHSHD